MANYDPFENRNDKRDENWFFKTATRASILAGLTFGASKLKNPLGKMVDRIEERIFEKEFRESEIKISDRLNFQMNARGEVLPSDISDPTRKTDYTEAYVDRAVMEQLRDRKIERAEINLLENAEKDIHVGLQPEVVSLSDSKFFWSAWVNNTGETVGIPLKAELLGEQRDQILAKPRKEALLRYFGRRGGYEESDLQDILSYNVKTDIDPEQANNIAKIHQKYMDSDSEYERIYKTQILDMTRKYETAKRQFFANPANKQMNPEQVKLALRGSAFVTDPESLVENYVMAKSLGGEYGFKLDNIKDSIDLTQVLSAHSGTRITSGSLEEMFGHQETDPVIKRFRSHPFFKQLGEFDYTGYLRRLKNVIGNLTEEQGVKNAQVEIIQKPTRFDRKFSVRITIEHLNTTKHKIEIPLANWGRIPGGVSSTQDIADGFYPIFKGYTMRDLMEVRNKSQQAIDKITQTLETEFMQNNFYADPKQATNRLDQIISNIHQDAIRIGSNPRYATQMLRVVPEQTDLYVKRAIGAESQLAKMGDAINNMNKIKKLARLRSNYHKSYGKTRNVKSITIDFETISRKLPGLQHILTDPYTNITKAAIVRGNISNGGVEYVKEYTSDHGYELINSMVERGQMSWDEESVNFLSRNLPEDTLKAIRTDPNIVDKPTAIAHAYGQWLKAQKRFTKKAFGHGDYKNNSHLIRDFGQELLKQIKQASNNGKNEIVILTKNGSEFDLKILLQYAPDVYNKILPYTLDLENVFKYQQQGYKTIRSRSIGKLIAAEMGRLGGTPIEPKTMASTKAALKFFQSKGFLLKDIGGVGSIDDLFNKFGGAGQAHALPTIDSIFEQILLLGQIQRASTGDISYRQGELSQTAYEIAQAQNVTNIDRMLNPYSALEGLQLSKGSANPIIGLASSSFITGGMTKKMIFSLIAHTNMLPFPTNKVTKQFHHLFRGSPLKSRKNIHAMKKKDPLKYRQIIKGLVNPITTETAATASEYFLGSDAVKNLTTHQLQLNTLYLWNPWEGTDGMARISPEVWQNYTPYEFRNVPLDDVGFAENPDLLNDINTLKSEIKKEATEIAKRKKNKSAKPNQNDWEEASTIVFNRREKHNTNIVLPKGFRVTLAEGDIEPKVINAPITGKITSIIPEFKGDQIIKMHARVLWEATPEEAAQLPLVAFSVNSKSLLVTDRALSEWNAYGPGVQMVADLAGISKGYAQSYKRIALLKVIGKYNDMLETGTKAQKIKAKKALKEIAGEMNADLKLKEGMAQLEIKDTRQLVTAFHKIKDPREANIVQKFVGTANISQEKLDRWLVNAREVWTDDMIKLRNNMMSSTLGRDWRKTVLDMINEQNKLIDKAINGNADALEKMPQLAGLDPQDAQKIKDENVRLFKGTFLAERGAPAVIVPIGSFEDKTRAFPMFGALVRDSFALNGMLEGITSKATRTKIRKQHFRVMQIGGNISDSGLDTIRSSLRSQVEKRAEDIEMRYTLWKNALFADASLIKHLSIDDIKDLTERHLSLEIKKQLKEMTNENDIGKLRELLQQEDDFIEGAGYKNLESAKKELENILKSREVISKLEDKKRLGNWKTLEDLKVAQKISIEKISNPVISEKGSGNKIKLGEPIPRDSFGVYSLKADVSAEDILNGLKPSKPITFDFDFEEMFGVTNFRDVRKAKKAKDSFLKMMERIYKSAERESKKTGKNIDSFIESFIKDKDNRITGVRLRSFYMPLDLSPESSANQINDLLAFSNNEGRQKYNVFEAYKMWRNDLQNFGTEHSQTKSSKKAFERISGRFLATALSMQSDGINYKSMFEYTPPAIMAKSVGLEQLQQRAWFLKNQGSYMAKLRSAIKKPGLADDFVDSMLKLNVRTVMISQDMFEKLRFDIPGGRSLSYTQYLDTIFKGDSKKKQLYMEEIMSGKRDIKALMSRDPIHAHGTGAIVDVHVRVIPEELREYMGAAYDGIHAFHALKRWFNADNDGDWVKLILNQLQLKEDFSEHSAEVARARNEIMERADLDNYLRGIDRVVSFLPDGGVALPILDKKGFYTISTEYGLKKTNAIKAMIEQLSEVATSAASMDPSVVTYESIFKKTQHSHIAGITNNLIGIYTNIANKRIEQLRIAAKADKNIDESLLSTLIGTKDSGITGISQKVIDISKHQEKLASFSNLMGFFMHWDPNNIEGEQAFKKEMMDSWSGKSEAEKEKLYNILHDSISKVEELSRTDKDIRHLLESKYSIEMGKRDATFFDQIIAEMNMAYDEAEHFEFVKKSHIGKGYQVDNAWGNFAKSLKTKIKLSDDTTAIFRKGFKFGAIGAAAYLGLNFFLGNRVSASINPANAFVDLGYDPEEPNRLFTGGAELPNRIPLDRVDSSFSKEAYIKLNKNSPGDRKYALSRTINDLLEFELSSSEPMSYRSRNRSAFSYSNYTSNVGFFGDPNIKRKYK